MHVERGAVRVVRPVRRVERGQVEPVGQVLADRGERLGDQVGHGQHGRPGVELVAVDG